MTIFTEYVYAVIDEASDHANGRVRGVEDYFKLTRLTDGGHTSFLAAEAGSNIPDEVMAHPSFDPEIGCRVSRPHTRGYSSRPDGSQIRLMVMARTGTCATSSKRPDTS